MVKINIKKFRREHLILLGIFLIALALRITTARFDLLLTADPWYHLKIAQIILDTGKYPMWEYYSRYPFGGGVINPPGLYYLPVYTYKLISFTGISFFKTFQLLPSLFGALTVIPLYFLAKELHNEKLGMFSALLFALSPAAIERGLAGFYRGDVFMVFMMLSTFYFFLRSVRGKHSYSIFAAIFAFFSGLVWNGWPFVFGVLSASFVLGMLINYFRGKRSDSLIISYLVTSFGGLILLYSFNSLFYRYEAYHAGDVAMALKFVALVSSIILFEGLNRALKNNEKARVLSPFAILFVAVIIAYFSGLLQYLRDYGTLLFEGGSTNIAIREVPTYVWRLGITEQRKLSISYLGSIYSILVLIAPIGFFLSFKRKFSFKDAFLVIYAVLSLSMLGLQIRFTFLAAPSICLLGGLALNYLSTLWKKERYVFPTIIAILVVTNAFAALSFSSTVEPFVTDDLYESLVWLRENTTQDSVILSWWDYTGPILAVADRKTVTHTAPSGIVESTSLMLRTSNESQALTILQGMREDTRFVNMKVDYILIDSRIYSLWQKISRFEPVVNRDIKVENRDITQSMLYKLYRKEELENFELAFENKKVRIFKPLLNYTRITEMETDKRYYNAKEEVKIRVKTRSNEYEEVKLELKVFNPNDNVVFSVNQTISGTSLNTITFDLPDNSAVGSYRIIANLYNPQMSKTHSMEREFIVIGS